jgi:hypothetical protein
MLRHHATISSATNRREAAASPPEAVEACVNLVRNSGAEGVIFPRLADLVMGRYAINPFGDETILLDADHPNTVCWNYASHEFLAVIKSMLDRPAIRMVRTTAQRYYDHGAPLEIFLDPDGGDGPPMPPVEGDITEGGYATPHWVPTMFVWNGEQRMTAG